jgi:hypothetical protein
MLAPRDPYTVFVPGWLAADETAIVRIPYTPRIVTWCCAPHRSR